MNTEIPIINRADSADAKTLTDLSIITFRDTFGPVNSTEDMDAYIRDEMNESKIQSELSDEANLFFVARMNDVAAGYVKMRSVPKPPELIGNNPMEIERLYVLHRFHGQKIGAALMKHCIYLAATSGHDVLWLGVWEHNNKAINFYTQWGFELFGSHPFVLGSDVQRDVLMKRVL